MLPEATPCRRIIVSLVPVRGKEWLRHILALQITLLFAEISNRPAPPIPTAQTSFNMPAKKRLRTTPLSHYTFGMSPAVTLQYLVAQKWRACFIAFLLAGFGLGGGTASAAELSGRVLTTDSKPIPDALVVIWTARPKVGTNPTCPSCYPDCGKTARTDKDGRFTIKDLDERLLFTIAVIAAAYQGKLETKLNPEKDKVDIQLEARDLDAENAKPHVRGQVVGPDGKALVGAR
ncbi:MAG: hypothetical protein AAGG72_07570, partial [Pseudomonadota bacterium]